MSSPIKRVTNTRASIPMDLGCPMLLAQDAFTSPKAFWIPLFRDFYGGYIT